jgi:hypothetical protein
MRIIFRPLRDTKDKGMWTVIVRAAGAFVVVMPRPCFYRMRP